MSRSGRPVRWWASALLTLMFWTSVAAAQPRDRREMQAREAYAAGRYQDALDLYVKLYAERLHPNFLRNIGRCYQNLGEPDKAISSFREYLRKARNLEPGEREEIQGYIREMEQLKQSRAAPAEPPPPAPVLPDPAPAAAPPESLQLQATAPPPEPRPVYKRWWFWTAMGAVLLGGALTLVVMRGGGEMPSCEAGRQCR